MNTHKDSATYLAKLFALLCLLSAWSLHQWACESTTPNETTNEITTADGGKKISPSDGTAEKQPVEIPDDPTVSLRAYRFGAFELTLNGGGLTITRGGQLVANIAYGQSETLPKHIAWRKAEPKIRELLGSYVFEEDAQKWNTDLMEATSKSESKITLRAGIAKGTITRVNDNVLRIRWSIPPEKGNRLLHTFGCEKEDRFFGGGARVHGTQHRGEILPNWVSEQGIGKLRRTSPAQGFPLKGGIHDTYLPVPFIMTQRNAGFLIENSQRSLFHLCPKNAPGQWSMEVWHHELSFLVISGNKPLDVIEQLTEITGRPKLSPKWSFAPWLDATHGQQKVLDTAKKLRKEKIPSSIIWTEDWVGAFEDSRGYHLHYQWNADTKLYPDLKGLTNTLHDLGFKFLGYFNPFLRDGSPQWKEAHDKGYAIKDADGKIVYFTGVFGKKTTLPDFTKPEVRQWAINYMKAAVALGFDGWMADYAEWLPLASKLSDGTDGHTSHNLYPLMWQKVNKEALDAARPNGDYVFFARSGWAGAGGLAPVFWAGDQQTSFDDNDGLQTVIPLCVDAGMSGIPIMTHDIAGYSSVGAPPTTKELFFRWTQLGAFSSIMRTHHGSYADQNWNWQKDAETIAMFKRYAELHIGMFPYRYTIAKAASDKGWPMMRHLYLHYPRDEKVTGIKDQFMLGSQLLVAPIVTDKARERTVYLPKAKAWYHFLNGSRWEGGKEHTVKADINEIPVFAPAGAIIPTILPPPESNQAGVDTLAPTTDSGVIGLKDAENRTMTVYFFHGDNGAWVQYDGTTYELAQLGPIGDQGGLTFSLNGQEAPKCGAAKTENCWKPLGTNGALLLVKASSEVKATASHAGKKALAITIAKVPKERSFALVIRW